MQFATLHAKRIQPQIRNGKMHQPQGPVHTRHIKLQLKLILMDLLTIFEIQSTLKMVA